MAHQVGTLGSVGSVVPPKISSYAKIAAMPAPNAKPALPQVGVKNDGKPATTTQQMQMQQSASAQTQQQQQLQQLQRPSVQDQTNGMQSTKAIAVSQQPAVIMPPMIDNLQNQMQKLAFDHRVREGSSSEPNADSADSYEEDQSQLSGSSLNKPQSFDTKSMASVTTFAMDDKESIRPDDSASVRAADDDHVVPSLSRGSSFQHEQVSRVFPPTVPISHRRFPTLVNPPRFGNLPISPVMETQDVQMPMPPTKVMSIDDPREPTELIMSPDEKLIDALASAKDRLPLLQLEEKVLNFLATSTTSVLELPPQNSFNRLLTHKLADYYSLPHAVNDDNTSVRIFRSNARVAPPPLAQLARALPLGNGVPSTTAVKIMRRDQIAGRFHSSGNSTAHSSSAPSKATSENGGDVIYDDGFVSPTESTPGRDKSRLTREEREAQYKAARDRIFAGFQESMASEATSAGDQSASLSRSSSNSDKKKNTANKRNKPRDDSFEARSAFALTYAPINAQYQNMYMEPAMNNAYPTSPNFDNSMYGATPTQAYPGFDTMQYPQMQGYPSGMPMSPNEWQNMQMEQYYMYNQNQMYPQPNMPMQMPAGDWYSQNYMPQYPQSAPYQPDYQTNFQQQQHSSRQNSRNKSLFNPQTRSFVPNDGSRRRKNNKSIHKEDSLKSKYGTPASLPKKPPAPSEKKHPAEVIDTAALRLDD